MSASATAPAALRGVFIAGTDTGVGKTRVSVALLAALGQRGIAAIGMKPVATGLDAAGQNEDVQQLQAAGRVREERQTDAGRPGALQPGPRQRRAEQRGSRRRGRASGSASGARQVRTAAPAALAATDINPYAFAPPISPHLAAQGAGVRIEPARIGLALARLAPRCDLLVVEGTGGWLAPIGPDLSMADVARELALPVVLVVGLRLGCLNHALLTARAIRADGLALAGWIGSVIEPDMLALADNLATLRERLGAPQLGVLAHSPERSADAAQLAAAASLIASLPPLPVRDA
jgi:dethiobiotin synthetase